MCACVCVHVWQLLLVFMGGVHVLYMYMWQCIVITTTGPLHRCGDSGGCEVPV